MRGENRRLLWHQPIDREILERDDVRASLAAHDIGSVYRILQRHGISQPRIAALIGSVTIGDPEIIAGRLVRSYGVLLRIALGLGLGVPRGWMDSPTTPATENQPSSPTLGRAIPSRRPSLAGPRRPGQGGAPTGRTTLTGAVCLSTARD